jgi:hypothetical protein
VVDDADLALDLDQPDDLLHPRVQQAVAAALDTELPGDGTVQPR